MGGAGGRAPGVCTGTRRSLGPQRAVLPGEAGPVSAVETRAESYLSPCAGSRVLTVRPPRCARESGVQLVGSRGALAGPSSPGAGGPPSPRRTRSSVAGVTESATGARLLTAALGSTFTAPTKRPAPGTGLAGARGLPSSLSTGCAHREGERVGRAALSTAAPLPAALLYKPVDRVTRSTLVLHVSPAPPPPHPASRRPLSSGGHGCL